jgi:hypothetical protein
MRGLVTSLCSVALAASAAAAAPGIEREVLLRSVAPGSALPADLTAPEGKTRWRLESLAPGETARVAVARGEQGFSRNGLVYSGADAERWLLPDRDPSQMKMGARVLLRFDEKRDGVIDHVAADVATVGIGWAHLPSGPEEVVLQRVRLGELLIHRWVSPREGVLVEVVRRGQAIEQVHLVESVLSGAATLKVYADQLYRGLYTDIKYGFDRRGSSVNPYPVPSLVPDAGVNNICDLVNLNTWNFSSSTSGEETATTNTPINAAETCNTGRCNGWSGYPPGGPLETSILERLDRNLTGTVRKDHQVVQRENRATDVTFWLRAGTQNENVSGSFGSGETRFCFTDEAGKPRNEVPLWQMPHNDAGGWYTQAGDTWTSVPLGTATCEESFASGFSGSTCGSGGTTVYSKGCTSGGQTFSGAQFSKVVKGGVVILPSGHTLNAIVLRNTTEFCQHLIAGCSFLVNTVRTVVYYWQSPFVGSVALLRGPQQINYAAGETGETPCTNFTTVDFTDISYGLLPPVSITAGATTGTTVSLSWNPGNDTHRIVGYKIYWDTDSGSSTAYAFNSVANAGQVAFAGTTATISGLTPGTTYYFTVTSLSDFTDPSSSITTRYESIKYPTTVSGDPAFSYPVEVAATTTGGTCIPGSPVAGVTVDKGAPPNIHVCWTALADPCVTGYDVMASSVPGFGVAGSVGLTTCWDGDPPAANLILLQVRARGTGGNGP